MNKKVKDISNVLGSALPHTNDQINSPTEQNYGGPFPSLVAYSMIPQHVVAMNLLYVLLPSSTQDCLFKKQSNNQD